jgi:hypothetical protein
MEGFVLRAVVHPAHIMDRDGVKLARQEPVTTDFPRLRQVWLDSGHNGTGKGKDRIEHTLGRTAEIVAHRRRPTKVWIFDDLPDDQIDWSKVFAAARLSGAPTPVGGRAYVCLARPSTSSQQGLSTALCD